MRQGAQRTGSNADLSVPTQPRSLLSLSAEVDDARLDRALARRRYEVLAGEFREEILADQFAARSAVASLFKAGSLVPPAPVTWRGRLGHWLIVWQSRLMWWTLRSFRMRDQAIESVWLTVESHVREQRGRDAECRRQLLSLEERIRRLESGRDE